MSDQRCPQPVLFEAIEPLGDPSVKLMGAESPEFNGGDKTAREQPRVLEGLARTENQGP